MKNFSVKIGYGFLCLSLSLGAAAQILKPGEGPKIQFDGAKETGSSPGKETEKEREDRLMGAGIKPAPTPTPANADLSSLSKASLGTSSENAQFNRLAYQLSLGMQASSWYALKPPKNSKIREDFSHAVSADWNVGSKQSGFLKYISIIGIFFNGNVRQKRTNIYNEPGITYSDFTASEWGAGAGLLLSGKCWSDFCWGLNLKAHYTPLHMVKARFYYRNEPHFRSQGTSHNRFSYQALHLSASVPLYLYYMATTGPIVSLSTGPFGQVRLRTGWELNLIQYE